MIPIELSLANIFQLHVSTTAPGDAFAFHLYRGKERLKTTGYGKGKEHIFYLEMPGSYRVKVFIQKDEQQDSAMSEFLRFDGFPPLKLSPDRRPIAVFGLSKESIAAAKVIKRRGNLAGIIDSSRRYSGSTIFDLPILGEPPENCVVIGLEDYIMPEFQNSVEKFRLEIGADDILSRHLHKIRAINLYRIAHELYIEGMEKQAHFLEMFILTKFNSRIPYQAVIGEGTELGVGGIGVAIHPRAIIGENCTIGQNTTIGGRARQQVNIEIGNNVYIGPGSKCVGGKIGNNVVVGANAVVTAEVPDNCVVAGVPAKIISRDVEDYSGYTHRRRDRVRPTR